MLLNLDNAINDKILLIFNENAALFLFEFLTLRKKYIFKRNFNLLLFEKLNKSLILLLVEFIFLFFVKLFFFFLKK